MERIAPNTTRDLVDTIADAAGAGRRLEICGGGTMTDFGAPVRHATLLDMSGFSQVIDYDPPELVLTVGAGTLLSEIEALVESQGQMLAFEPFDHAPVFGRPVGAATIGGVVASAVSGSRRLSAGAVRDHVLGFEGVSGRSEHFKAGGKVVKNVTGYDLPKLIAGSRGRLVALTQLTLKVLPRPRVTITAAMTGLSNAKAISAMTRAMGSRCEVAAAAHLPAAVNGGAALTLFRFEGFRPSVEARLIKLQQLLRDDGAVTPVEPPEAEALWTRIRAVAPLAHDLPLWRINIPPSEGAKVAARLAPAGAQWFFDWAGGLLWLTSECDPAEVRTAAAIAGGHATLVRAPAEMRARVPALHPTAAGVAALEARLRRAFDPAGVFETGRFLDNADAD